MRQTTSRTDRYGRIWKLPRSPGVDRCRGEDDSTELDGEHSLETVLDSSIVVGMHIEKLGVHASLQ